MLTKGQRSIKYLSDVSSFLSHALVARREKSGESPNNKVKRAVTNIKMISILQKVNPLANKKFRRPIKRLRQLIMMRVIKITQILYQISAEFLLTMKGRKKLSLGRNLGEALNLRGRIRYVVSLG
jgi:hypothetical protein